MSISKEWGLILDNIVNLLASKGTTTVKSKYRSFIFKEKLNFCPQEVLKKMGSEVLIRSCRVDLSIFEEYAARGFFNVPEINNYRRIIDITERSILMEMTKEE